ncbi:hypothetical protein C0995_014236 [Termitomyces sp. Mi166|nr:hypothetical protein C0995_014236 [Termitomyces sp. Mi166\
MIKLHLALLAPLPLPASAPSASTPASEGPVSEPSLVPVSKPVSTFPVPVPSLTPPMPPTPASSESVSVLAVSAPAQVVSLSTLLAPAPAPAPILPVSVPSEPVTALAASILSLLALTTSVTPPLPLTLALSESVSALIVASVPTPAVSFSIPPAAVVILPMPSPTLQVSVPVPSDSISAPPAPVSFLPEPVSILPALPSIFLNLVLPAPILTMAVSVLTPPKPVSVPLTNSPSALVHSLLAPHSPLLPVSANALPPAPPTPFLWCKNTVKTEVNGSGPRPSFLQPPPEPPPFDVTSWQSTTSDGRVLPASYVPDMYPYHESYLYGGAYGPSIRSGPSYYMPSNYGFPYSGTWQANPVFPGAVSDARQKPGESPNMSGNTQNYDQALRMEMLLLQAQIWTGTSLSTCLRRCMQIPMKAAKSNMEEILKPKLKPLLTEEQDNEIKEVPQKSKSKRKGKAKAIEATDDIVEIPPPSEPLKAHRQNI